MPTVSHRRAVSAALFRSTPAQPSLLTRLNVLYYAGVLLLIPHAEVLASAMLICGPEFEFDGLLETDETQKRSWLELCLRAFERESQIAKRMAAKDGTEMSKGARSE